MADISPPRRRMIEDMTVRNLSPATQRSHLHAVGKFSQSFGRWPDTLTLEDVRTFQVHLASKSVIWAGLNQTVAALRFFHGVTLGMAVVPERIAYAREPRRLPVVLSANEVARLLEAVPSLKTRAALTTAYAAGLGVSEVTALISHEPHRRTHAVALPRPRQVKPYRRSPERLQVIAPPPESATKARPSTRAKFIDFGLHSVGIGGFRSVGASVCLRLYFTDQSPR